MGKFEIKVTDNLSSKQKIGIFLSFIFFFFVWSYYHFRIEIIGMGTIIEEKDDSYEVVINPPHSRWWRVKVQKDYVRNIVKLKAAINDRANLTVTCHITKTLSDYGGYCTAEDEPRITSR